MLVITAACSRYMTGRMIPTRKAEELLRQLGRVPRLLILDDDGDGISGWPN